MFDLFFFYVNRTDIVLGVFTAPLHSNNLGVDHIENSISVVEVCLLRACVYRIVA
jgi:hypothetical protein